MSSNTVTVPSPIRPIAESATSGWTRRPLVGARIALGAFLLFSVVNAVLGLAPQPPVPAAAQAFLGGLFSAPYFFALLKGAELLVALALLSNRFVPLALVVLAPITVNIVLFHVVLAPAGAAAAVILLALHLATAWSRRASFKTVLAAK